MVSVDSPAVVERMVSIDSSVVVEQMVSIDSQVVVEKVVGAVEKTARRIHHSLVPSIDREME
jgi:hypothetical protein